MPSGKKPAQPSMSVQVVDASVIYETVAAGQTDQPLAGGDAGAAGDFLNWLLIQPGDATPAGAVVLKDGATTVYTLPAATVTDVRPIFVPIGAASRNGAWTVTTPADVTVIAVGQFS